MIGPILIIDLSVSWGASGFSPASKKFADDFGLPSGLGTLGLSAYVLGLAFGPMTLAPLSEVRIKCHLGSVIVITFAADKWISQYYGRRPVYIYSYFVYLCLLAVSAVAPNLAVFLPVRLLSGYFASVTIGEIQDQHKATLAPTLLTQNSKLRGHHCRSLPPT